MIRNANSHFRKASLVFVTALSAMPVFIGMVFALLFPSMVFAVADPHIDWKQIETEHFIIIFDSRQQALGEEYARAAEQAWTVVGPVFTLWPKKTAIFIDDETDLSNGSATGFPYPLINAYPVLPTALDQIGDYGSWGVELLTHEYTHILNFEPATGIMGPLRSVFGSIIEPNLLLPRWYSEGLAVNLETRLSRFGRLRSVNFLSIVRAMAEANVIKKEDISRVNEVSIPDSLGGSRPYLLGALVWDEMIRLKGIGIVKDLNFAYSRRIPFFIDGPPKSLLGLDYSQILEMAYDRARDTAAKQLEEIHKVEVPPKTKLEQTSIFSQSPSISPDGFKLAFVGKEHNFDSTVELTERSDLKQSFAGLKSRRIVEGQFITAVSWLPDSSGFVYNTIVDSEPYDRYYLYSDLWRYDLATKARTRLTNGSRAREAVVSKSGHAIVFIQSTPGGTTLSSSRIDGSNIHVLYAPPLGIRVSKPEFIAPREIIYAEKSATGAETFKVVTVNESIEGDLSVSSPAPREVLADYKPVHYPKMTSRGLLFVSDKSGVANLYLAKDDFNRAHAITNGTTRIMAGDLDATTDDLIYGSLDAIGAQLYLTPRESWSRVPAAVPQVGPLVDIEYPVEKAPEVDVPIHTEDYNPLPFLYPHYWLPYAYFVPEGLYFQASIGSTDPVGRHAYSLALSFDTLTQRPSVIGTYVNETNKPFPFTLIGEHLNEFIYSYAVPRQSDIGMLDVPFFIPGLSNNWTASAGFTYTTTEFLSLHQTRGGPDATIQYSNAKQRGLQISPERGGSISLTHTQFLEQLGSEYYQTDLHASYYSSKWLPDRHALALFANASIAPNLDSILYGRSTIGGRYTLSLVQNAFLMRGYDTGSFLGRNMVTGTAEYRFPISYTYEGFGTWPLFLRRIHGDVFADTITLDGLSYNFVNGTAEYAKLGTFYVGTGLEAKLDATVFYQVPVQFIFGLYYGLNRDVNPTGFLPFLGIGL